MKYSLAEALPRSEGYVTDNCSVRSGYVQELKRLNTTTPTLLWLTKSTTGNRPDSDNSGRYTVAKDVEGAEHSIPLCDRSADTGRGYPQQKAPQQYLARMNQVER